MTILTDKPLHFKDIKSNQSNSFITIYFGKKIALAMTANIFNGSLNFYKKI